MVEGYDPVARTNYTGNAEITRFEDIYHIHWNLSMDGEGGYEEIGTGLKLGSQVSFMFKNAPGQETQYQGVQVFKIRGDTLDGRWVQFDSSLIGKETLKKIKS